jgi:GT2 family glycosyltransferase
MPVGNNIGVSIVIPTWNGRFLLETFLPSVLAAVFQYQKVFLAPAEVILVDDGSTDDTAAWLEKHFFQQVCLIRRTRNGGFAQACNTGFRASRYPLVLLLNNDVDVDPHFIGPLVEHFEDPKVFAVTPKVFDLDRKIFCNGGKVGRFRHGFWSMFANYDASAETGNEQTSARKLISISAIGGFSMFDRSKLTALQGFDELFSPYHWEDNDLSYRAWKRGWEIHYEPRSLVYHNASSTIDSHFHKKQVEVIATRNRLMFHWKNLHSPGMFASHLLMLFFLLLINLPRVNVRFYRAFAQALGHLPQLRRLRRQEKHAAIVPDKELRHSFQKFFKSPGLRIVLNRKEAMKLSVP